jgi:hypothetical protein
MKISGKQTMEVEIDEKELGYAIMSCVIQKLNFGDDAGCDWLTYGDFTYIGDKEWIVSDNRNIARLVDAANILKNGRTLHP